MYLWKILINNNQRTSIRSFDVQDKVYLQYLSLNPKFMNYFCNVRRVTIKTHVIIFIFVASSSKFIKKYSLIIAHLRIRFLTPFPHRPVQLFQAPHGSHFANLLPVPPTALNLSDGPVSYWPLGLNVRVADVVAECLLFASQELPLKFQDGRNVRNV